jgi:hypothetical protein
VQGKSFDGIRASPPDGLTHELKKLNGQSGYT